MNTDQMIKDDLASIEAVRPHLAKEFGVQPHNKIVQAGVEILAKHAAEDLEGLLSVYSEAAAYVGVQDSLKARIRAIRTAYGIR